MTTVSAVVVSYNEDSGELHRAIEGLLSQTRIPDEILVVDNGGRRLAEVLADYHGAVRIVSPSGNLGYSSAVNLAAAQATCDYLLCLNPDAHADSDCLERLVETAERDANVALVGAQVLLADHRTRNAGANPVHPTGISPAGGYGLPREEGEPRDVLMVSGACCLVRRRAFHEVGGFVGELFMYYDDVDLGWRLNLAGHRVVYDPAAVVSHSFEFSRSANKWFYLERNRLFAVIANYQLRTLIALGPLLLATEAGLIVVSLLQGWVSQKLRAYSSLVALRSRLMVQRRLVGALRRRSDAELVRLFDPRIDSALISPVGARVANAVCEPYLRLVGRYGEALGRRDVGRRRPLR